MSSKLDERIIWAFIAMPSVILSGTGYLVNGVEGLNRGLLISFGWFAFTFVRTSWVGKQRMKVLNYKDPKNIRAGLELYDRLESFETMLIRWWVWDVTKFIRPES